MSKDWIRLLPLKRFPYSYGVLPKYLSAMTWQRVGFLNVGKLMENFYFLLFCIDYISYFFLFDFRLDLFFNVNCEKNESTTIGIIPTNEWPCFKNQIEKKACIQFFYDLKPEEILLSE